VPSQGVLQTQTQCHKVMPHNKASVTITIYFPQEFDANMGSGSVGSKVILCRQMCSSSKKKMSIFKECKYCTSR
jgi:hypothetical protein